MRTVTLTVTFLCLVSLVSLASGNDENMPDSLVIERVEVPPGANAVIKIDFVNDQELAALTIPLSVIGGGMTIDSVSFVGSRVEYLKMRPVTIADNRKDVVFGAICMTEDYVPAGRGLMATLYLSPTDSVKTDLCMIDTTTVGPASVLFTKKDSASFIPEFASGMVTIKAAKAKETKGSKDAEEAAKKEKH